LIKEELKKNGHTLIIAGEQYKADGSGLSLIIIGEEERQIFFEKTRR